MGKVIHDAFGIRRGLMTTIQAIKAGKQTGMAFCAPTINVSVEILTCELERRPPTR